MLSAFRFARFVVAWREKLFFSLFVLKEHAWEIFPPPVHNLIHPSMAWSYFLWKPIMLWIKHFVAIAHIDFSFSKSTSSFDISPLLSYHLSTGLRKVYPYYFTFTTFTKGRWVGEKILDVFAREFRAHPAEEYERCIKAGTLTVNYEKVPIDYKLKHNDLLANIVHR